MVMSVQNGKSPNGPVILLTGATGCVGEATLKRLLDISGDCNVIATQRSGVSRSTYGSRVRWVTSSLEQLPGLLKSVPPINSCIHTAAAVHDQPGDVDVFEVNVEQTLRLAQTLIESPKFRCFVFASTVGVTLLEEDQAGRVDAYRRSKQIAEQRLSRLFRNRPDATLTVLRLATVYGPGDRGNIGRMFDLIRRRRYVGVMPDSVKKRLLWSMSAGEALAVAGLNSDSVNGTWVVADPRPYTLHQIEECLASVAGVSVLRLPQPATRLVALLARHSARVIGRHRLPAPVRTLATLAQSVAVSPDDRAQVNRAAHALLYGSLAERFGQAYGPQGSRSSVAR